MRLGRGQGLRWPVCSTGEGAGKGTFMATDNPSAGKIKSWIEVFVMPIVVGVVGGAATYFISGSQIQSAQDIAAAERASAEKRARVEQQLKLLEMFSAKITSSNPRERELAVRLLRMLDQELASKLAEAIAADETETPKIRTEARTVAQEVRKGDAFPVVRSVRDFASAVDFARRLRASHPEYPAEVYLAENAYYAVTLGGYLDRDEAARRVKFARDKGIAPDAYVWQSRIWGDNLLK